MPRFVEATNSDQYNSHGGRRFPRHPDKLKQADNSSISQPTENDGCQLYPAGLLLLVWPPSTRKSLSFQQLSDKNQIIKLQ